MRKFLIATHGKMAGGIKNSLGILIGNTSNVTTIDAYLDDEEAENVTAQIEAFYATTEKDDQVFLMSDISGGSVNQLFLRFLDKPNSYLITGINLPLVIELAVNSSLPVTPEEIENAIAGARAGMMLINNSVMKSVDNNTGDFFG